MTINGLNKYPFQQLNTKWWSTYHNYRPYYTNTYNMLPGQSLNTVKRHNEDKRDHTEIDGVTAAYRFNQNCRELHNQSGPKQDFYVAH